MNCPNCQTEILGTKQFCGKCGTKLSPLEATPATAPVSTPLPAKASPPDVYRRIKLTVAIAVVIVLGVAAYLWHGNLGSKKKGVPPNPARAASAPNHIAIPQRSATAARVPPLKPAMSSSEFNSRFGWYVESIKNKVTQAWFLKEIQPETPAGASVYVQFNVNRDGSASAIEIKSTSGFASLDSSCLHAVERVGTFDPIPAGYPENSLSVQYRCTYRGSQATSTQASAPPMPNKPPSAAALPQIQQVQHLPSLPQNRPALLPQSAAASAPILAPISGPTGNPEILPAPQQLNPEDGAVFNNFPRKTTVAWSAVPGAASYLVEIEFADPPGWDSMQMKSGIVGTSFVFNFVGKQTGRWRVWAVDSKGHEGEKSPWRKFIYTV